jgi:hypothetical protein
MNDDNLSQFPKDWWEIRIEGLEACIEGLQQKIEDNKDIVIYENCIREAKHIDEIDNLNDRIKELEAQLGGGA